MASATLCGIIPGEGRGSYSLYARASNLTAASKRSNTQVKGAYPIPCLKLELACVGDLRCPILTLVPSFFCRNFCSTTVEGLLGNSG